jgi:hypothetical protein
MSNIGLHYYKSIKKPKKLKNYIENTINSITNNKIKDVNIDIKNDEIFGLVNWGEFGGGYTKNSLTVYFDGYLLDDYKLSKDKQLELLANEFLKKGIDSIKQRNFIGNILFITNDNVHIVTPQHTIFYLFYHFDIETKSFYVSPAPKFMIPMIDNLTVNENSKEELLKHEHCLSDKTLFNEIKKISPNSILKFNKINFTLDIDNYSKEYWDNTPKLDLVGNAKKDAKKINELFRTAIEKSTYIFGDKEFDFAFSGGTDSSYILSHMLDLNKKVNLNTLVIEDNKQFVTKVNSLLKLKYKNNLTFNTHTYPNKVLEVNEIEDIIKNRIDLRECSARLFKDWQSKFTFDIKKNFVFSDGSTGDDVAGLSRIENYTKIKKLTRAFLTNSCLIKDLLKYKMYNVNNLENINKITNNKLLDCHLYIFNNRKYNYINDIVHINRNFGEYYLSPFLDNDFFRVIMQYQIEERINYKLYYYLLKEQCNYFDNIPTENINNTISSSWFMYKIKRFNPFELILNRIKYIFMKPTDNIYNALYNDKLKEKNSTLDQSLSNLSLKLYDHKIEEYKKEYGNTNG